MRRTGQDILRVLAANREAFRRLGVKRLGLFGSGARDELTAASDLDFLVELAQPTFDGYMDLKELLEDLFQCRVDLILADNLKPRLKPRILQEVRYAPGL